MVEWSALWLTFKLASLTACLLLLLATPIAWWLSRSRSALAIVIEALVALPLVLPPTVIGFYLLVLLSPSSALGAWWFSLTNEQLTFSFAGLVIASVLYSLPFAVQPLYVAFSQVSDAVLETGATLGASKLDRFVSLVLPLSRRGYIIAFIMAFAHTVGEFGVVLMIGGNIPGETRLVSVVIYEAVETLNYDAAHALSLVLMGFSLVVLTLIYGLSRQALHPISKQDASRA